MGAFTGMDTESVRQFGEVLMDRAQSIQGRIDELKGAVEASSTFWVGADGDDFRMAHTSRVEVPEEQLTAMLTPRVRELAQQAAYDELMEQYRNQAVEVDARSAAYEQGSALSVEEFKRIRENR